MLRLQLGQKRTAVHKQIEDSLKRHDRNVEQQEGEDGFIRHGLVRPIDGSKDVREVKGDDCRTRGLETNRKGAMLLTIETRLRCYLLSSLLGCFLSLSVLLWLFWRASMLLFFLHHPRTQINAEHTYSNDNSTRPENSIAQRPSIKAIIGGNPTPYTRIAQHATSPSIQGRSKTKDERQSVKDPFLLLEFILGKAQATVMTK